MGQVTRDTLNNIEKYAERKDFFPLTPNEMQQLAYMAGKWMDIYDACRAVSTNDTEGYPEGFDETCGIEARYMRLANSIACSLNGKRIWDVPHIAAHLKELDEASRAQSANETTAKESTIKTEKQLEAGQIWHVRFPKALMLSTLRIIEITPETVVLKDDTYYSSSSHRYVTKDIEFIERVSPPEQLNNPLLTAAAAAGSSCGQCKTDSEVWYGNPVPTPNIVRPVKNTLGSLRDLPANPNEKAWDLSYPHSGKPTTESNWDNSFQRSGPSEGSNENSK